MARTRSVKPDFWTSPQIFGLSEPAALSFVGLWNFCDCNGIHPADPQRLKFEIAAGRPEVTPEVMAGRVQEMLDLGLVREYAVNGTAYWLVTGWKRHQYPWKPHYRYPLPADMEGAPATGGQRPRGAPTSNKSKNKDAKKDTEKGAPTRGALGRFKDASDVYPPKKKKNLSKAREVWARDNCDDIADMIIADILERQAKDVDWLRGAIPHFPTYLNQRRWNDPIEEVTDDQRQTGRRRSESATERVAKANPRAFEPDLPENVTPLKPPEWPEEA